MEIAKGENLVLSKVGGTVMGMPWVISHQPWLVCTIITFLQLKKQLKLIEVKWSALGLNSNPGPAFTANLLCLLPSQLPAPGPASASTVYWPVQDWDQVFPCHTLLIARWKMRLLMTHSLNSFSNLLQHCSSLVLVLHFSSCCWFLSLLPFLNLASSKNSAVSPLSHLSSTQKGNCLTFNLLEPAQAPLWPCICTGQGFHSACFLFTYIRSECPWIPSFRNQLIHVSRQWSINSEHRPRAKLPGFESCLWHLVAVGLWGKFCASVSPSVKRG